MIAREEARRLLSALLGALGLLALVALVAFLLVPGARFQAPAYGLDPAPDGLGETGWLDPTDTPAAAEQVLPALDPAAVLRPKPELLARGRLLYGQQCAQCHGAQGRGDGPAAAGLKPPARDFGVAAGWTQGFSLEAIYRTLEQGIPGTAMASYASLGRQERMALAHVVQGFAAFQRGPEASAALVQLFSGTAETRPARIPVRLACARLIAEFSPAPGNPWAGAGIQEAPRAAQTLAGVPAWKTSQAAFVQAVVAGVPGNGFAPVVLTYTPDQWQAFHRALRGSP